MSLPALVRLSDELNEMSTSLRCLENICQVISLFMCAFE